MSDFIQGDILSELWKEILKLHWKFLDTEEGKQKIEERLKVEGCLKEFLCVVPHDRKFFLPETAYVLRQTIRDMDDFTATKGIIGFETVNQYANNLFTKPWRKEFRVLKMYSGSFQHEIKSNLLHAVKLFEAMGYRHLNDETLILDGPICPDQVTNVSRDAMTAYVECQIMKQIQMGLAAMDLKCSLWDIFNYREKYIGGISNAIKELSYAIQDRRHRKEKLLSENSYSTIQHLSNAGPPPVPPPPPPAMVTQCQNCMPYYHNIKEMHQQQQHNNQSNCAVHQMMNGKLNAHYAQAPHMSHSRSLEHYDETPPLMPHRHSFDHQHQGCTGHHQAHYQIPRAHAAPYAHHLYESPYDCIDGGGDDSLEGSSASYAAVLSSNTIQTPATTYAHPYNVSGNRYPLPYNISNQLNANYSKPTTVTCNGVKGTDHYGTNPFENMYATVSKQQQQQQPMTTNWNQLLQQQSKNQTNSFSYRQRTFPPEQLIDFDDRALLTSNDYHANYHHHHSQYFHDDDRQIEREYNQHNKSQFCLSHANGLMNPMYAEPKDILCQQHASTNDVDIYGNGLFERPMTRRLKEASNSGPQNKHLTDKYIRKTDSVQVYDDNNRKMPMELNCRGGGKTYMEPKRKVVTSSHTNEYDNYEESTTLDDFVNVGHSEHPQRSPTQASKNQDGVGSFESWDYVYQNLDRSGYSKDVGERGDLLVKGLDLDSLNLTGAAGNQAQNIEKRHSGGNGGGVPSGESKATNTTRQLSGEKSRTLEKLTSSTEKRERKEKPSILKQATSTTTTTTTAAAATTTTVTAAAATTTTTTNGGVNRNSKSSSLKQSTSNNLNVDHSKTNGNANNERNIIRQISNNNGNTVNNSNNKMKTWSPRSKQTPAATQVLVSNNPNEWSCQFCTFLNPDTKRICEICCRSKDLNLDATVSNTPTCV